MRAVKSVNIVDDGKVYFAVQEGGGGGWGGGWCGGWMRAVLNGGLWRTNYFPLRSLCLRHGHVTLTDDPMLTRGREGDGT